MIDINPVSGSETRVPAFLSGKGNMSERIRQFNWAETKLGPVSEWKQSLRSVVSICLNSNFPIGIYWGPDLVLLYNDAWSPIPGNKHPWALGRPAREVWPEIWKEIAPQFDKAISGEPGGSKNAMLPMLRHGYTEECYFDFTFTPVFGEDGNVDGVFNAVIETTYQIIIERRTSFLHRLSQRLSTAVSREEVFKWVNSIIKKSPADIPFCMIYSVTEGQDPVLVSSSAATAIVKKLPIEEVIQNGTVKHIGSLNQFMENIPIGIWPEFPSEGLIIPLKAGNGIITGFLFTGLNARRRCDREYQLFVEGFATVIGTALNTLQSLEEERNRVAAMDLARIRLEKSEAALRLANDQLELTFRNVPAAIYLFDKNGKIIFANNQAQVTAGKNNPNANPVNLRGLNLEWIHQRTFELFDLHDESGNLASMENTPGMITFHTGKPAQQIIRFTSKLNGTKRWILATTSPLLNESGELTMVLACSTDITIQKEAEEKIRASEENFRSLTHALPQLVWVTDARGKQEYVTDRWREYTGLEPRDILTWANIVHPDDSGALAENWMTCLKNGTTYKGEARLRNKDGLYRWFHVHGEPIRNEKNEIIQWVGAFTDIHEQKMAEELLRQSEEKLEFLVKKRTEQLERSNEDLQQFAHVASHDLKEPIRKIKIFTDLLEIELSPNENENAKLYLTKIKSATDRMLLMMEGVLHYAALDGYRYDREKLDLNEIIRAIQTDLETVIQRKSALIVSDPLPEIPGYAILIYQLFYNLISNALKFSRPDKPPRIEIRYSQQMTDYKPMAVIVVKDNGIGFEPRDAEKIFYSFSRLNAKEDYEGTGLGLSLCKKIVSRHQGYISASGEPGVGAEFTVKLPLGLEA
jgi:PAS domain S-box-containing protein